MIQNQTNQQNQINQPVDNSNEPKMYVMEKLTGRIAESAHKLHPEMLGGWCNQTVRIKVLNIPEHGMKAIEDLKAKDSAAASLIIHMAKNMNDDNLLKLTDDQINDFLELTKEQVQEKVQILIDDAFLISKRNEDSALYFVSEFIFRNPQTVVFQTKRDEQKDE